MTNPVSNMKLAVGRAFPYPQARAAGVAVGLGTDGAASNNSLDLLADMKVLALLQKHTAGRSRRRSRRPRRGRIATGELAPVLGRHPDRGRCIRPTSCWSTATASR